MTLQALLFAVVSLGFLLAVTAGAAPVLLPAFVDEFSLRISEAGILNGAYGVGRLLAGIVSGFMAGRLPLVTVLFSGLGHHARAA